MQELYSINDVRRILQDICNDTVGPEEAIDIALGLSRLDVTKRRALEMWASGWSWAHVEKELGTLGNGTRYIESALGELTGAINGAKTGIN